MFTSFVVYCGTLLAYIMSVNRIIHLKRKCYGFIFNWIYHLSIDRTHLLLALLQMY
jgi:hypothetical protein